VKKWQLGEKLRASFVGVKGMGLANRTHIRNQCRKTTVLSSHRCLINTGIEKNELHLNID
jgi:hypothetical protein